MLGTQECGENSLRPKSGFELGLEVSRPVADIGVVVSASGNPVAAERELKKWTNPTRQRGGGRNLYLAGSGPTHEVLQYRLGSCSAGIDGVLHLEDGSSRSRRGYLGSTVQLREYEKSSGGGGGRKMPLAGEGARFIYFHERDLRLLSRPRTIGGMNNADSQDLVPRERCGATRWMAARNTN